MQGGPLRARNFRQRFVAQAVVKAGLGHLKVTPPKLRHTAASLAIAIASGADVNVVQTTLGHKSATLTLEPGTSATSKARPGAPRGSGGRRLSS
nr:tyrosine-type recombinase/integrase [Streptomyces xantholiticus]